MTALTEAHLDKLNDEDLRTLALRIVNDAISYLDPNIEEHDLTNHPNLNPAAVHEAADWIHELLTNPDNGYSDDTLSRHDDAVRAFRNAAWHIRHSATGYGDEFALYLNADAIHTILFAVTYGGGTPHRPSAYWLHVALVNRGDGFIPSHATTVGYVLKAICATDDPRLPALAETYLQSGLHVNLRPAIDEATNQLASLDELADLNR